MLFVGLRSSRGVTLLTILLSSRGVGGNGRDGGCGSI